MKLTPITSPAKQRTSSWYCALTPGSVSSTWSGAQYLQVPSVCPNLGFCYQVSLRWTLAQAAQQIVKAFQQFQISFPSHFSSLWLASRLITFRVCLHCYVRHGLLCSGLVCNVLLAMAHVFYQPLVKTKPYGATVYNERCFLCISTQSKHLLLSGCSF